MVIHQRQPKTKFARASSMPETRNQMILTRKDTAPPPYTISFPNGKKETGAKYLIQPKGDHVTWLCGLYRFEDGLPHFVVLTRPPSEEISFIHDRMPLMLREKDVDEWISPDAKPDEIAYRAVTDLHYEKAVQTEKAPPPVPDLFLPSTFE